jgi:hypothetical protein
MPGDIGLILAGECTTCPSDSTTLNLKFEILSTDSETLNLKHSTLNARRHWIHKPQALIVKS